MAKKVFVYGETMDELIEVEECEQKSNDPILELEMGKSPALQGQPVLSGLCVGYIHHVLFANARSKIKGIRCDDVKTASSMN